MLASKANQSGKKIAIENPEVVNGLQTSTEIYNYFSNCNTQGEARNILIRIIVPNALESRDHIIKATNSQTAIPPASLRATDSIHRDIEEYLKPFGLYYDRRKNYYKNEGKPINKIIGIPQMAQAVMAIVLQKPDTARARPSSLMKKDEEYRKLFNREYPIEIYRACARIIKQAEDFLNSCSEDLTTSAKTDLKFYIAMAASILALSKVNPQPREIAMLSETELELDIFKDVFKLANSDYISLGATDKVAKGPELSSLIKLHLKEIIENIK